LKRTWLIQFRKSKNLTQEQVATSAFIDRGYYSQVETGKRNPGLNIAINIAKVLDFDPLMFYQEHLDHTSFDKVSDYKISEYFRSVDSGEILYVYNSLESHFQHVITFLISGFEKKSYCLIIDHQKNCYQLQEVLGTILTDSEILNYIHFFNKEDLKGFDNRDVVNNLVLQNQFDHFNSIRIWLSEEPNDQNDWLSLLEKHWTMDIKLHEKNILFIRSYNASLISAAMHIKMMRNYPHLMTDLEIVDSPFYKFSNKSFIFPSLFIQKNM